MEQLLLVNPRGRKKRRTPSRNAKGRFVKRAHSASRKHRRRRRNPVPSLVSANPRRRRRHVVRSRRRYRRNPIGGGFLGNLTRPIVPAIVGAGGAIATDAAFGYLPLPVQLKTGNLAILSKAVVAVALGMLVGKFMNRRIGEQMTAGALTVQAHSALAPMVASVLPGLGYYGAGYALPGTNVGEYISALPNSLSEIPNSLMDSQFYSRDPMGEYISD